MCPLSEYTAKCKNRILGDNSICLLWLQTPEVEAEIRSIEEILLRAVLTITVSGVRLPKPFVFCVAEPDTCSCSFRQLPPVRLQVESETGAIVREERVKGFHLLPEPS